MRLHLELQGGQLEFSSLEALLPRCVHCGTAWSCGTFVDGVCLLAPPLKCTFPLAILPEALWQDMK